MSHLRNLFFILLISLFVSFLSCEGSIEPAGVIENEVNSLDDDDSGNDGENEDNDNTDDNSDGESDQGDDSGDNSSDDDTSGDDSGDDNNDDGNGNTGDDNNDNTTILGEWILVSAEIENGQASTVFNGADIDFPFSATSKDEDAQVLFSENPDEVSGSGQFTSIISYTLFNQTFTDETTLESPITNGTWTSDESSLTIVDNDGLSNEFSINEFSGNSLIIETSFTRSIVLDGLDVDTNGMLILEFIR